MINIIEIKNLVEKIRIVEKMVENLPEWFGENTTIADIEAQNGSFEKVHFFSAFENNEAIGFISLKTHNENSVEIGMMGVSASSHGKDVGKKLVNH